MIEVRGLKKTFDGFAALDGADLSVPRGAVYGLVGPNGAGKTTLLRHLTGVYHQDSGSVTFDGQPVWENVDVKARIASIPDDWFYFMQAGLRDMMRFYRGFYPHFNAERYEKLKEVFALDETRPLRRMSKGQQKQAAFWLAMCAMPDYLILDEPVDGLDPVMRRQVWSLILQDVAERGTTVLVSSHNLRELEDVCDHVGVMSRGKLLLEHSLSELQDYTVKLQLAFEGAELPELPQEIKVLHHAQTGRVHTLICRGSAEELEQQLAALCMMMTGQILAAPVFYFVGNILVPGMEYLLRNFAGNFLYGYSGHTDVALGFLSPPLYMYTMCTEVAIASIETCESDSYYVTAYALEHRSFMILAAYALAGLVIALIALLLYRTRKSEMTGSTVAFPWATPIFKYGVAFCTAVALGQFLYYFLFGQYRSGGSDSLPGTILCMVAAGLVGYFVAEMLIKKSFRVFRAGAKGAVIVSLALVLLGVTMSFDLTGYEKRVPDESEIESAFYTFSGMTHVTTDDADTIRRLTAAHQAIVKNRNEQARIADAWDADALSQSDYADIEPFSLRLTYYLKDGSQLSRSYSLYLRRSDLTAPSSVTARVNALYTCRESVLCRVLGYGYEHLGDTPRFLDSYCYYYDDNSGGKDYALTAAQAEQVYAALMQDVQDSDNGGSDIFAVQEHLYDSSISFSLELYFESTNEKGRPEVYTLSPPVNGSTPNTLQVLNELLPELKSNTVTPPSDDGIHTLPATEDVSTTESVN